MFIISLILLGAIFLPIVLYYFAESSRKNKKITLTANIITFVAAFVGVSIYMFTGQAFANAPATPPASDIITAAAFISAALVTGLGAIGTGIAVSSTAAAAIGAISENSENFGKAMIFVAMAEGIAIYGLLISFMILGRI